MFMRHPVVLTSVEEDFRKIGLLPQMNESDDPAQPREVPSPDPSTLAGLDDSEGDKSAHGQAAKQPSPSKGPADETDDEYEPVADGGSKGAVKQKSGYKAVPHGKEASIKGEGKGAYTVAKQQMVKGKGQKVKVAQGLKPTKKIGPMSAGGAKLGSKLPGKKGQMESKGRFGRAATLIEEVESLLHGVQVDEQVDHLVRGFGLVSESAALLADRLTEISGRYQVDKYVAQMESLSRDAAETLSVVENEMEMCGQDDASAIAHSAAAEEDVEEQDEEEQDGEPKSDRKAEKPYTVDVAFKESAEKVFHVMVGQLMNVLEAYDSTLDEEGDEQEEGTLGKLAGAGMGAVAGLGAGGLPGAIAGGTTGAALGDKLTGEEEEETEEAPPEGIHHLPGGKMAKVTHNEDGSHTIEHEDGEVHHYHPGSKSHKEPDGDEGEQPSEPSDDDGDESQPSDDDGQDGKGGGESDGDDDEKSAEGEPDGDEGGTSISDRMKKMRDARGGGSKAPFQPGR